MYNNGRRSAQFRLLRGVVDRKICRRSMARRRSPLVAVQKISYITVSYSQNIEFFVWWEVCSLGAFLEAWFPK